MMEMGYNYLHTGKLFTGDGIWQMTIKIKIP